MQRIFELRLSATLGHARIGGLHNLLTSVWAATNEFCSQEPMSSDIGNMPFGGCVAARSNGTLICKSHDILSLCNV